MFSQDDVACIYAEAPLSDTRSQLREQLQRSSMIERAIQQAPVTFWAMDMRGKVLLCEGGGLSKLPQDCSDCVGKSVEDIECHLEKWKEGANSVRSGRKGAAFFVRKGSSMTVEHYGPLLSPSGRLVGVLALSLDIEE